MKPRNLALALLLGGLALGGPTWAATPPAAGAAPSGHAAPAAQEDIRDIHGPIAMPSYWRWVALAGGGALVVSLVSAAVLFQRRRPRVLTAEERALALLAEAQALAVANRPREYAQAASEAIRAYIEQRFGLRAAHTTTDEFLHEMLSRPNHALTERRETLMQFLAACDLAKFARYELAPDNMQSLHELARQFVLTAASDPKAVRPSLGRLS